LYVTVALCWSGSWTAGKLGVGAVPPIELSAIRFAIAGLLMFGIARATGASLGLARWKLLLVASFFGIFAYNALVFVGLTLGPASDGALIVPTLNPVMTVCLATFLGERLTRSKIAGIALATLGAAVVVVSAQSGLEFSSQRLVGDLLMLGGAACWSVYATLGVITTRSGSPLGVTAVACLAGSAMLFPFGFLEHGYQDVPAWPVTAWLDIAYLVVFATIIGFVLFYYAVRRFGAGTASMVSYLVPMFALVQAVFLLIVSQFLFAFLPYRRRAYLPILLMTAIGFAIWVAAGCAAGDRAAVPVAAAVPEATAAAAPVAEPTTVPSNEQRSTFRQGPDAQQTSASLLATAATGPGAKAEPLFLFPRVAVQPARYVTVPMPNRQVTASELTTLAPTVADWSVVFARGLDGVRHPVQGVDSAMALRALTAENRVARVFERWAAYTYQEVVPRTFVVTGSHVTGGLARAWGTMAYVDADIDLIDRGATDVPIHVTLRLRPMGFSYTVIDLFDRTVSGWLIGNEPRYSAIDLETELPAAASQYLSSESFSPGHDPYSGVIPETPFGKTRNDAILALGGLKAAGTLVDRYFEKVTATIDRFEPAWFGGDGVVTVHLAGTLVERSVTETQRIAFVQPLKFFRTPEGFWTPVDALEADGSWDSGGDLALGDVAKPHG